MDLGWGWVVLVVLMYGQRDWAGTRSTGAIAANTSAVTGNSTAHTSATQAPAEAADSRANSTGVISNASGGNNVTNNTATVQPTPGGPISTPAQPTTAAEAENSATSASHATAAGDTSSATSASHAAAAGDTSHATAAGDTSSTTSASHAAAAGDTSSTTSASHATAAGDTSSATSASHAAAAGDTSSTTVGTENTTATTSTPVTPTVATTASYAVPICTCNLTPGACDIDCCCDSDCNLTAPETVFTSCLPGSKQVPEQVCVADWMVFRSNVPYQTSVVQEERTTLFCVHVTNPYWNYFVEPRSVGPDNFQTLAAQYRVSSFIQPSQGPLTFSKFYKAGDPVLTYFQETGALGVLGQPTAGVGGACVDTNPSGFLQSGSTSCTRTLSNVMEKCTNSPALNAATYYKNFTILKNPPGGKKTPVDLQVTYLIIYNGTSGIQNVSVNFTFINLLESVRSVKQTFRVNYLSQALEGAASAPKTRSGNPGYIAGAPLLTDVNRQTQPVTILQSMGDGSCSRQSRTDVLFGHNMAAGCTYRVKACQSLQSEVCKMLQGDVHPRTLSMFGSADLTQTEEWTEIIDPNCPQQEENCMEGCSVPVSTELQVLWAYVGPLSNPQAQVLGGRYLYHHRKVQCPTEIHLTSTVSFIDTTRYPQPPPRGQPSMDSKLPFDFFFPFIAATSGIDRLQADTILSILVPLLLLSWSRL
nr:PREDICTED: tectonic-3 [Latimeria chalumnae]|eukprot:XP_006005933.1 PREDICTED: tectonic-3 [Latimeria chalumnae]